MINIDRTIAELKSVLEEVGYMKVSPELVGEHTLVFWHNKLKEAIADLEQEDFEDVPALNEKIRDLEEELDEKDEEIDELEDKVRELEKEMEDLRNASSEQHQKK